MKVEFFGFVPSEIEPQDEGYEPRLDGFPFSLLYAGERQTASGTQIAFACYRFDPTTFFDGPDYQEMKYFPRRESLYYVTVRRSTKEAKWETFKYRGEELVCIASGPEFERAMVQTTLVGLMPDEIPDE